MEELHICPSTLAEGFHTYSPAALKQLFDGEQVSHVLPFDSPNNDSLDNAEYAKHVGRISLSDTRTINRGDFEEFGRRIGLASRLVKRELDTFATEQPLAKELINRSFLSDKLKKYYWQSFNYRRLTLSF